MLLVPVAAVKLRGGVAYRNGLWRSPPNRLAAASTRRCDCGDSAPADGGLSIALSCVRMVSYVFAAQVVGK